MWRVHIRLLERKKGGGCIRTCQTSGKTLRLKIKHIEFHNARKGHMSTARILAIGLCTVLRSIVVGAVLYYTLADILWILICFYISMGSKSRGYFYSLGIGLSEGIGICG